VKYFLINGDFKLFRESCNRKKELAIMVEGQKMFECKITKDHCVDEKCPRIYGGVEVR